jgi:hypothetical protein
MDPLAVVKRDRLVAMTNSAGKGFAHKIPKDEIDPCSNVRAVLLPKSANRRSLRDS